MPKKYLIWGQKKFHLNSAALHNVELIEKIAHAYGSQAVVVSVDAKKTLFSGERVFEKCGTKKTKWVPHEWAKFVENAGAGEIIFN